MQVINPARCPKIKERKMETSDLQELDYGITMSVCALVKALGMVAENQDRLQKGQSIAYTESSFDKLIDEYGVHHNAVLSRWQNHF